MAFSNIWSKNGRNRQTTVAGVCWVAASETHIAFLVAAIVCASLMRSSKTQSQLAMSGRGSAPTRSDSRTAAVAAVGAHKMRKMREKDIAALIERDLLKAHEAKTSNTIQCFSCGRGIIYKASRFCSQRCRDWYDGGNPGHAQDWIKRAKDGDASMLDGYVI